MDLKTLKSKPMDITDLRKYLPDYAKAVLYKTLSSSKKAVFAGGKSCVVVLYETTINRQKQGHFVVLIDRQSHIEYFSSLGKSPQDELGELQSTNSNSKFSSKPRSGYPWG